MLKMFFDKMEGFLTWSFYDNCTLSMIVNSAYFVKSTSVKNFTHTLQTYMYSRCVSETLMLKKYFFTNDCIFLNLAILRQLHQVKDG